MSRRKQLLIVEDDKDIVELMHFHLSKDLYLIDVAEDGRVAYDKLLKASYDLVIMDWMIPGISGLDIIIWMRKPDHKQKNTPVLMVTAKSDPTDIIKGLEAGADDYMIKPFDFDVLRARVQNLLKRIEFLEKQQAKTKNLGEILFGDIKIDQNSHRVYIKNSLVDLTFSEFKLLEVLILNQGKVLSRKKIISFIQKEETVVTGRTIDTHISSLRKKLGAPYGDFIETVRGVGYRISYNME